MLWFRKRRRHLHLLWRPKLLSGILPFPLCTFHFMQSEFHPVSQLFCLPVCLQDECSEDGTLAEEGVPSDVSSLASKPTILKQLVNAFWAFHLQGGGTDVFWLGGWEVPDLAGIFAPAVIVVSLCRPCILIMDSLRGPTRSTVVKTLREWVSAAAPSQCGFTAGLIFRSSWRVYPLELLLTAKQHHLLP